MDKVLRYFILSRISMPSVKLMRNHISSVIQTFKAGLHSIKRFLFVNFLKESIIRDFRNIESNKIQVLLDICVTYHRLPRKQ